MALLIEPAASADIDRIEQLYDSVNDYLAAHVNYSGWTKGVYPIRQDAEEGFAAGALYVARRNGEIAGSVILNNLPEQPPVSGRWRVDAADSEVFTVHTLVVNPVYTGQGIGGALLRFADGIAREKGCKAIRLDVYERNLPAIRLYERCGYQYIDTVDIGLADFGLPWFRLYEKPV